MTKAANAIGRVFAMIFLTLIAFGMVTCARNMPDATPIDITCADYIKSHVAEVKEIGKENSGMAAMLKITTAEKLMAMDYLGFKLGKESNLGLDWSGLQCDDTKSLVALHLTSEEVRNFNRRAQIWIASQDKKKK